MVMSEIRRAAVASPIPNRQRSPRAVHLSVEYWPWARTGGLAEAVRGLAESLHAGGVPTAMILPLHRGVREAGLDLEPVGDAFRVLLGTREEPGRLFRLREPVAGPPVYFIDHPDYFDRAEIYGEPGSDYPDNARRFGFFTAAALHVLPDLVPDARVAHVHDWHTALAPVLARTRLAGNPYYDRLGTVLTVHNAGFQGHFAVETLADLGLPTSLADDRWLGWYGGVNWLKGGLMFADRVTTVSPTHARELRTATGGFGLHEAFDGLRHRFVGIVNGITLERWDPTTDPAIPARFSARVLEGKYRCKAGLQAASGLAVDPATPLIGMSARMVGQKGLPIIVESLCSLSQEAQFIFLGRGEPQFERALQELAAAAPDRIAFDKGFTDDAEHRLLAGVDILLMPSLYEPCGLTQMRAQRYGAIPVARRVGGLVDTIEDGVTGFLFDEYSAPALQQAVRRAVQGYATPAAWQAHVRAAMRRDFGWARSAAAYREAYRLASGGNFALARVSRAREETPWIAPQHSSCAT